MERIDFIRERWYNSSMENFEQGTPVKTEQQPKSFWKKIGEFFDKNYALIFAPVLVGCLYLTVLAIMGIAPFGEKYTAASYDLSAQICPFVEHLFDVMQGKSTLTYSYAIVGGADVTGTFLYFFISPFSFLFLIFGDGKVAHASSIVMVCKLMAIAFSGTWFAKTQFKRIPEYLCSAVGCVYAYCGYMFVANTYINWMDFLIYMPFCAAAFRHYVNTGKFVAFSITVACCIYTCFSIACFSLFTVFPALVAYGLICVEKDKKMRFIAYMALSFAVALLIALPVLLPALGAFLRSARGGSIFENLWKGFSVSSEGVIGEFDSSVFLDSYSQSLYRKWSYIIADSVFVALTVVWFIRTGLKDKFAQFMLVAGGMTLLPLIVDEAMNLMNMGSYMSYALRFGFLNALYFLGGACLAIDGWCYERGCAFDGKPLFAECVLNAVVEMPACEKMENEGGRCEVIEQNDSIPTLGKPLENGLKANKSASYICMGLLIAFALLAMAVIALLCLNGGIKTFWSIFIKNEETLSTLSGFSARFAHSLGGAEAVVIPFVFVIILVAVGCFMVAFRKISPRFLTYILIGVVGMQVVFYNCHLITGNKSSQHINIGYYQEISEVLNEREDKYFRIKDYNDKLTACVPFSGNANSFSVFSSVIDKDNFTTFQLFGYLGNGKNSFKSGHNKSRVNRTEVFGDCFIGYKYFLFYANPSSKDKTVEQQLTDLEKSKTYLKKVTEIGADGKETHLKRGDFYVYENTIVFPSGYRIKGESFQFVKENIGNSTNRKKNQAALYQYLRGKDIKEFTKNDTLTVKSATELSEYLWERAADVEVGAGKITARVTAEAGEHLLLNFVASKGYTATLNGKPIELLDNDLNFLSVALEEGENEVVFTYTSPYVKYAAVGLGGGVIALAFVYLVLKKTKLFQRVTGLVAWAAILLATAVVAFFMLYPTCVFTVKLISWVL